MAKSLKFYRQVRTNLCVKVGSDLPISVECGMYTGLDLNVTIFSRNPSDFGKGLTFL